MDSNKEPVGRKTLLCSQPPTDLSPFVKRPESGVPRPCSAHNAPKSSHLQKESTFSSTLSLTWAQTLASCLIFSRFHFSNPSSSKQPNKTPQAPLQACDLVLTHPGLLGVEAMDIHMAIPTKRGCYTTQSQAGETVGEGTRCGMGRGH